MSMGFFQSSAIDKQAIEGHEIYIWQWCDDAYEYRAIHINTHSDAHEYSLEQELWPKE